MSIIDTTTDKVTAKVSVGIFAHGIAVSPDGKMLYITTHEGVYVIDTTTNTVTAQVKVGDGPEGITITPDGKVIRCKLR